jgi:hypothetical protein
LGKDYFTGHLSLVATWAITWPLDFVAAHAPFLVYFAVILFSACYGGSRSALIASVASAISAMCLLYPHRRADWEGNFGFLIACFLVEALLIKI